MPRTKLPDLKNILDTALLGDKAEIVKFLHEHYKEHVEGIIRTDAEKANGLGDEEYGERYAFLQGECGIDLKTLEINPNESDRLRVYEARKARLLEFTTLQTRAEERVEHKKFNNTAELFDLLISQYLDNSTTNTSISIYCPFGLTGKEYFTFSHFNISKRCEKKQIKVSTQEEVFPGSKSPGNDWTEYSTVCHHLDEGSDKKQRIALAERILECMQYKPLSLIEIELDKIEDYLDSITARMRKILKLDKISLNPHQLRAANMMFGLSICEHDRVPGALKHFRACLRLVMTGQTFSEAFMEKCVLTETGGTGKMREVFETGRIPDEHKLEDDPEGFTFSSDSDNESAGLAPKIRTNSPDQSSLEDEDRLPQTPSSQVSSSSSAETSCTPSPRNIRRANQNTLTTQANKPVSAVRKP